MAYPRIATLLPCYTPNGEGQGREDGEKSLKAVGDLTRSLCTEGLAGRVGSNSTGTLAGTSLGRRWHPYPLMIFMAACARRIGSILQWG
jgi:hypothetical protein